MRRLARRRERDHVAARALGERHRLLLRRAPPAGAAITGINEVDRRGLVHRLVQCGAPEDVLRVERPELVGPVDVLGDERRRALRARTTPRRQTRAEQQEQGAGSRDCHKRREGRLRRTNLTAELPRPSTWKAEDHSELEEPATPKSSGARSSAIAKTELCRHAATLVPLVAPRAVSGVPGKSSAEDTSRDRA